MDNGRDGIQEKRQGSNKKEVKGKSREGGNRKGIKGVEGRGANKGKGNGQGEAQCSRITF
jgi:hypothetical protein